MGHDNIYHRSAWDIQLLWPCQVCGLPVRQGKAITRTIEAPRLTICLHYRVKNRSQLHGLQAHDAQENLGKVAAQVVTCRGRE